MKPKFSCALALVLAVATLAPSAASAAPDEGTAPDVRCLVIASMAGSSSNPEIAKAGVLSALYFVGRIDGRAPALDLENALMAEAMRMSPADMKSEALRCAAILKARGDSLTQMGADLQRRAGHSAAPNAGS